jgi:polyisoprenoid-binding protein YceI
MLLLRSWFFRIPAAVVVLLVVLGGVWYFFIREDNEVQKEARAITDVQRQAAGAASGAATPASTSGSATYRLIEGQSEAWYLAPEKLAVLPTSSVAKGTTKNVTGEIHLTAAGLDPDKESKFVVGLKDLKSDDNRRDRRTQATLETSRFPDATFIVKTLTGLPQTFPAGQDVAMQMTGPFTVHGVTSEVTWQLKAKKDGNIVSGLATLETRYDTWGMRPPSIARIVSVEDTITIQVQLFLTAAS